MKKIIAIVLSALLIIALLSACKNSNDSGGQNNNTPTPTAPATTGGANTPGATNQPSTPKREKVTMAIQTDVMSLVPYISRSSNDFTMMNQMFDGLIKMTTDGTVYPQVAKKWEVSDDGKEYTFYLRDDVKFHNGDKLTAADVAFTVELARGSPARDFIRKYVDHAEIIDEYTIKLVLLRKSAPFMSDLAGIFRIMPEKAYNEMGEDGFAANPIGCGPFEFVSFKQAESLTLRAFKDYYGGPVAFSTLEFKIIPEASSAFIALETGEIDLFNYIPTSSIGIAKNNNNLQIHHKYLTGFCTLGFNLRTAPFDNLLLRQAIACAIDKEFIVDGAYDGYATPAKTLPNKYFIPWPESLNDYGFDFDIAKAKDLMAQAGYPDGKGLPTIVLDTQEAYKKTAVIIQSNLDAIGIKVDIQINEQSAQMQKTQNGDFVMYLTSPSLFNDLSIIVDVIGTTGPLNSTGYSNSRVDDLLSQGLTELDPEKRKVYYEEAIKIFTNEVPFVPLVHTIQNYAAAKDLDLTDLLTVSGYGPAIRLELLKFK